MSRTPTWPARAMVFDRDLVDGNLFNADLFDGDLDRRAHRLAIRLVYAVGKLHRQHVVARCQRDLGVGLALTKMQVLGIERHRLAQFDARLEARSSDDTGLDVRPKVACNGRVWERDLVFQSSGA